MNPLLLEIARCGFSIYILQTYLMSPNWRTSFRHTKQSDVSFKQLDGNLFQQEVQMFSRKSVKTFLGIIREVFLSTERQWRLFSVKTSNMLNYTKF